MLIYADPSAFVKLWIVESRSDSVREVLEDPKSTVACSAIGRVEIISAIRRAYKSGRISGTRFGQILRSFRERWQHVVVVEPSPEVINAAEGYAIKFALRGYDAMHLASMLLLARSGTTPVLACFDDELTGAAKKSGVHILAWHPTAH